MAYNEEKHIVTVPLESYLDFAAALPAINVDEFWSSTLEEQDDEIREFLERRVHPVGIGDFGLNWDDVMLPSQKKRRLDYNMEYERKVRERVIAFPARLRFTIWTSSWDLMGAYWWTALLAVLPNCRH